MKKATIKIVLDTKPLSNDKHAVYLRITKNRKSKKISLGLEVKKEHFVNESFTRQHENSQIENEVLLNLKSKAFKVLRNLQLGDEDFSLNDFEEEFRGESSNLDISLMNFFNEIIEEMNKSGRIGNAKAYKDTRDSLIKFNGEKTTFNEVTPGFLDKFEAFLRSNKCTNGGIAFRMRELRALFNTARRRKIIPKEPYPFEVYKISKLKSETSKVALTTEEFKRIRDIDLTDHPHLLEAHNYFMFSVYCRGINFMDMVHLKWSNIRNNRIYYTRSKTKGKLNLEIIPNAQSILDYYKSQKRPTDYVFPILLHKDMTPKQIANRHHKVIQRYNKKLKEIASLTGVEKPLTSYVARHSFATIMKMKGTPIEKITEMMGHSDVSITLAYLKEFSNEDLDSENRKFMEL